MVKQSVTDLGNNESAARGVFPQDVHAVAHLQDAARGDGVVSRGDGRCVMSAALSLVIGPGPARIARRILDEATLARRVYSADSVGDPWVLDPPEVADEAVEHIAAQCMADGDSLPLRFVAVDALGRETHWEASDEAGPGLYEHSILVVELCRFCGETQHRGECPEAAEVDRLGREGRVSL